MVTSPKILADGQTSTYPLSLKSQPVHTIIVVIFSHLGLFNSDPTDVVINKMVQASQRRVTINSQRVQEGMSPALKRHLELQIRTLQNAPRDPDKLEWLLKANQREKE